MQTDVQTDRQTDRRADRHADRQTDVQTRRQTGCCSGNLSPTSSSRAAGCRSTSLRSVQLSPPALVHQADARRRVSDPPAPLHLLLLHRPDWRAGERRDSQAETNRAEPTRCCSGSNGTDRTEVSPVRVCCCVVVVLGCCCCCFVAWRTETFLWRWAEGGEGRAWFCWVEIRMINYHFCLLQHVRTTRTKDVNVVSVRGQCWFWTWTLDHRVQHGLGDFTASRQTEPLAPPRRFWAMTWLLCLSRGSVHTSHLRPAAHTCGHVTRLDRESVFCLRAMLRRRFGPAPAGPRAPGPARSLPAKLVSEHVVRKGVCVCETRAQPISGRCLPTLRRLFTTDAGRWLDERWGKIWLYAAFRCSGKNGRVDFYRWNLCVDLQSVIMIQNTS